MLCRESLATPRCAATGIAFQAGTIADKGEILTFGTGFALIALHAGLLNAGCRFINGGIAGNGCAAGAGRLSFYVFRFGLLCISLLFLYVLLFVFAVIARGMPNGKNSIYIHRLAVDPEHQKKGVGSKLMDFAENKSKSDGAESIRLDTFSQNTVNQNFYKRRGYVRLEDIYFPLQSEHPFHCYELLF